MFAVAITIELYAYLIYLLGLSGLLQKSFVVIVTLVTIFISFYYARKNGQPKTFFLQASESFEKARQSRVGAISLILIATIFLINLIGALAPEIAFDALWYHLTLPKIFIQDKAIHFIPGGLFYYSTMPKMIEMLYIPALMTGGDQIAKLIHLFFGLLTTLAIYIYLTRQTSHKYAVLGALIFYSNLVVAWQSTTAYIDLGRAFFELLAFIGFVQYRKTNEKKWLIESALMMGAALTTKWLALGSLGIFAILFTLGPGTLIKKLKDIAIFSLIAITLVLPFLITSYIQAGNPFYPIFSGYYKTDPFPNLAFFLTSIPTRLTAVPDPISPIYLIMAPLTILFYKRFSQEGRYAVFYSLLALVIWLITPDTGGGRFILPYLPVMTITAVLTLSVCKDTYIRNLIIFLILIISLSTLVVRAKATTRYLPVVFGLQSKDEFLTNNLNFGFGDFYDTDGYIKKNILSNQKVLVYGIHNLYYLNVPYVHESYIQKGETFDYILAPTKDILPRRFESWDRIYTNPITGISLYKNNNIKWVY